MHKNVKIIGVIVIITQIVLVLSGIWLLLSIEHYKTARYTVERVEGQRIYYDGGYLSVNQFYFGFNGDMNNLSKGDDIIVHYLENAFGRTYVEIDKLN